MIKHSILTIEKNIGLKWQNRSFGDIELGLLLDFLKDNLLGFPERILKWLENPDVLTGGDATTLHPEDGKIVIRYEWWDEDNPEEVDHKYETTAPQLISAIHQWIALQKTDPDAILIEQDEMGTIPCDLLMLKK